MHICALLLFYYSYFAPFVPRSILFLWLVLHGGSLPHIQKAL
jgi:hypothetical protein